MTNTYKDLLTEEFIKEILKFDSFGAGVAPYSRSTIQSWVASLWRDSIEERATAIVAAVKYAVDRTNYVTVEGDTIKHHPSLVNNSLRLLADLSLPEEFDLVLASSISTTVADHELDLLKDDLFDACRILREIKHRGVQATLADVRAILYELSGAELADPTLASARGTVREAMAVVVDDILGVNDVDKPLRQAFREHFGYNSFWRQAMRGDYTAVDGVTRAFVFKRV